MIAGLACLLICMAPERPAEVSWNELAHVVLGRTIAVRQPTGSIQGRVLKIEDQAMVAEVNRVRFTISRSSVIELRVGGDGRGLGTAIGALAGFVGGMEIAETRANGTGTQIAVLSAVLTGSTIVGYRLGRKVATRWRTIRILPDRSPQGSQQRDNDER